MAFWQIFQKMSNYIETWDFSPEMKEIVAKLDKALPDVIKKALIGYIKTQYDKSEDIAMESLKRIRDSFNEIL